MNICFIKGKIITKPEYKFTFIRNADAVIMFERIRKRRYNMDRRKNRSKTNSNKGIQSKT